jgi:hypothetical protein
MSKIDNNVCGGMGNARKVGVNKLKIRGKFEHWAGGFGRLLRSGHGIYPNCRSRLNKS